MASVVSFWHHFGEHFVSVCQKYLSLSAFCPLMILSANKCSNLLWNKSYILLQWVFFAVFIQIGHFFGSESVIMILA